MNASPQSTKQKILRVAVPSPLRRLFDYIAPQDQTITPGCRVLVPFGPRKLQGIVIEVTDHSSISSLKSILEIIDPEPLFPPKLLELFIWASSYYQYPLGMLIDAALPAWLRKNNVLTPPNKIHSLVNEDNLVLNEEQQAAVDIVSEQLNNFKPFLLDGVTGSGKTEVYMQLISKVIASNRQVLVLVPEINLTPQTLQRFQNRFAVPIAVLHSQISEKKRAMYWLQAQNGTASIVLGTRLAAFTPLKNPGLFIIDEEHDLSFKQQDRFRYSARDLLLKRAQLEQCPIILGTATPSLETWHNAQTERYHLLPLTKRAGLAQLPEIEITDIRHKKLDAGLSNYLIAQIREHLAANNQILLFINRRGYAPVSMCFGCGWHQTCLRCDSNMIYHANSNILRCHHCLAQSKVPEKCPKCSDTVSKVGLGTQRIEECLIEHFPTATIARVDSDTVHTKKQLQDVLDKVENGETNILIGTQMLAKGHHFPNISLVAIVDIDSALFSADFRAVERIGQLITQVAGRTGRGEQRGKVILQTTHPEHPILTTLIYDGYHAFIKMLSNERSAANLPPFSYQVLLRAETKYPNDASNFLSKVKGLISSTGTTVSCLGPIPAPMTKRQGYYRAQLMLQASQRKHLQTILQRIIPKIEEDKTTKQVRWTIDVDPAEMY